MTNKQYYTAARRKLGIKAADVLGWGVRDGTIRITLVAGQQHIIPLSELEPKGKHDVDPTV